MLEGKWLESCKEEGKAVVLSWYTIWSSGVPKGGGGGSNPSPPEIPKTLRNRARLNPIVKTVKNFWI